MVSCLQPRGKAATGNAARESSNAMGVGAAKGAGSVGVVQPVVVLPPRVEEPRDFRDSSLDYHESGVVDYSKSAYSLHI